MTSRGRHGRLGRRLWNGAKIAQLAVEGAGASVGRILFLQSFGYAADGVRAPQTAREMLTEDGFILLTRTGMRSSGLS